MNNPKNIPIDSVMAKLQHAEGYFDAIKNHWLSWKNSNPYRILRQTNADLTRYSLILHIDKEPPLQNWSLIIGDIIHNLRCALDHLVYAIAVYESGQEPPPLDDRLMFPICDTSTVFMDQSNRRLATLSPGVRATIEAVQPYNRPHAVLPPLLSILRNFDNRDNHKLIHLIYSSVQFGNIGFCGPALARGDGKFIPNFGELEDGAEIAAVVFDSPAPRMDYDRIIFDLIVAMTHGKRNASDTVFCERSHFIGLIDDLINEVSAVIDIVLQAV